MHMWLEAFLLGKLSQVLSKQGTSWLDWHWDIGDVGKKIEVFYLVVFLNNMLNSSVVMSVESQIVIQEDIKSEDNRLSDVPVLKGNSSLNFIH